MTHVHMINNPSGENVRIYTEHKIDGEFKNFKFYSSLENNEYHFYDDDVNLNKVCIDALYDQKTGFIVIGENSIYVGIINLPEFMNYSFPNVFYEKDDSLPYIILKSFKKDIPTWIEWIKKETKRFKNKKKKLNKKVFNRNREKEKNYFKVMQF